jgi:hypothetical protein
MKAFRNKGLSLLTLLVLQMSSISASHAQSALNTQIITPVNTPVNPLVIQKFNGEISKQEGIYQSTGAQVPAGYSIDRSLADYTLGLTADFDRTLADLGPKDRWMDIGAGRGHAILDYYAENYDLAHPEGLERRGSKAKAVAVSIEDRRATRWLQESASVGANKVSYFFSKPLQAYSQEELGQFQVITDVIGGFSYVENLSQFVEKVMGFLELNGSFFTVLQDVRSEGGANRPHYPGARFLTEIANADGSEMKMCSWLKRITCVEVTCEFTTSWKPPIEAYRLRKVCNNVSVPALVPTHFQAGTPPERRFRLDAPAAVTAEQSSVTR